MKHIDEEYITNQIISYLHKKKNGSWDPQKTTKADLHQHGVDIKMVGGKQHSEYFFIECKGKSYSNNEKSAKAINKEGWLNALGQIITRMNVERLTKSRIDKNQITNINRAYKYGLGLYYESAQVALKRIPKEAAKILNLYIFSVNDKGEVKQFSPKDFGKKEYPDELFK